MLLTFSLCTTERRLPWMISALVLVTDYGTNWPQFFL